MNPSFRFCAFVLTVAALSGCATQGKPPPRISLDEPLQAQQQPEPPKPVEVVEVPKVLPMPGQMKPLPEADDAKPAPESPAQPDGGSLKIAMRCAEGPFAAQAKRPCAGQSRCARRR
jgi:hypothetical protein